MSSHAAQREPLPQAATSSPSAFQKRTAASTVAEGMMAMIWSQPTPVARSAMARAVSTVGSNGPKGLSARASNTTKSLPSPFIFRKGRRMGRDI